MAEYAIRELGGYGLSHLLIMGNTTDFTGTPLEPLMGDGMFRHFRPIFRGTLIANTQMDAERGNRLIAEGIADLVAFGRPFHRQSRPGPTPQDRRSARRDRLDDCLWFWTEGLFRLPGSSAGERLIPNRPNRRTVMSKTTSAQNKALVLEAFDTLFNKRDYVAAESFLVRSLHPA